MAEQEERRAGSGSLNDKVMLSPFVELREDRRQ